MVGIVREMARHVRFSDVPSFMTGGGSRSQSDKSGDEAERAAHVREWPSSSSSSLRKRTTVNQSAQSSLVVLKGSFGRIWNRPPVSDVRCGELTRFTTGVGGTAVTKKKGAKKSTTATPRGPLLCPTPFSAVTMSENADRFGALDSTGRVYLLQVANNRWSCIASKGCPGTAVIFAPNMGGTVQGDTACGELIAAFQDGSICVYSAFNLASGGGSSGSGGDGSRKSRESGHELLVTFRSHRCPVTSLACDPSGNVLFSSSVDNVVLWDLRNKRKLRELGAGPSGTIHATTFPEGDRIATVVRRDGSVWIWDALTLSLLDRIAPNDISGGVPQTGSHEGASLTTRISISRDGIYIAVCSASSSRVVLINAAQSKVDWTAALPSPVTGVHHASFIAGSHRVCVLCNDGCMRVIDAERREFVATLVPGGDERHFFGESFAIDNRAAYMLATTSDGMMRLFDFRALLKASSRFSADDATASPSFSAFSADASLNEGKQRSRSSAGAVMCELNGRHAQPERRHKSAVTADHPRRAPVSDDYGNARDVVLDRSKLSALLTTHGEFPTKYRCMIWRFLLRVPLSKSAFQRIALIDGDGGATKTEEVHPCWTSLERTHPLRDGRLLHKLKALLSRLTRWCGLFGHVAFLPQFVFPFAKLFGNDEMGCFETVATLLLNEAYSWFEMYPHQPLKVLSRLEQILVDVDYALYARLHELFYSFNGVADSTSSAGQRTVQRSMNYGPQMMLWTLMKTLLTDVLKSDDWLKMMDNVVNTVAGDEARAEGMIGFVALSFLLSLRESLMRCRNEDELMSVLDREHVVNVVEVVRRAKTLMLRYGVSWRDAEGALDPVHFRCLAAPVMRMATTDGGAGDGRGTVASSPDLGDDMHVAYSAFTGAYSLSAVEEAAREREAIQSREADLEKKRATLGTERGAAVTAAASSRLDGAHESFITEKMQLQHLERKKKAQVASVLQSLAEQKHKLEEEEKATRLHAQQSLETAFIENLNREKQEWTRFAEGSINEMKAVEENAAADVQKKSEEMDRLKQENESLVQMLRHEASLARDAKIRTLDGEIKQSIKSIKMKQQLASAEAGLQRTRFDAVRAAQVRDAKLRADDEQERAARAELQSKLIETELVGAVNSSKADAEHTAALIQREVDEILKRQRENAAKREELLEKAHVNQVRNQLTSLEQMHKSAIDEAFRAVHEANEETRREGYDLQSKIVDMERQARAKLVDMELVKASDDLSKKSASHARRAQEALYAAHEARLNDEILMKEMTTREKLVREQLKHERELIDAAYRATQSETLKFNELRRQLAERRMVAESEDMRRANSKMHELSLQRQSMVSKLDAESRVKVQMDEIEAMRRDAREYEKLRKARAQVMREAEDSLANTQPFLVQGGVRGNVSSAPSTTSARTDISMQEEEEEEEEEERVGMGDDEETFDDVSAKSADISSLSAPSAATTMTMTTPPRATTDPSESSPLRSMVSPEIVDVLEHYLHVAEDDHARNSKGKEAVDDDDIDSQLDPSVSPAIHAEAQALIRRHIRSRDRTMSMITKAGSDSD